MGSQDRIYGAIFCFAGGVSNPNYATVLKSTLWALELLPPTDAYPPLTRNCFSLTSSSYRTPGLYKELVVHFGLTIKDVAEDWDIWLDKFESFLEKLSWTEARVHLELGSVPEGLREKSFEYRWRFPHTASSADRDSWQREGGPREFGSKLRRYREAVVEAMCRLKSSPHDVDLLLELIRCLARLRKYEEASRYCEQLASVDPEAWKSVPLEMLMSWGERCLSNGGS